MVCASAFQPSSVGLGCRVIPALGGFAQQFQPGRVSVSLSDCRLPFCKSANNLFRTLRKTAFACLESGPLRSGSPQQSRARKEDNTHVLQKSHHSHRISRPGRGEPIHTERNRFHPASRWQTSMSWKEKGSNEYKTRTEWHRIVCWNKLADWGRHPAERCLRGDRRRTALSRLYSRGSRSQRARGGDSRPLDLGAGPLGQTARFCP
jgi:hypothetical protein